MRGRARLVRATRLAVAAALVTAGLAATALAVPRRLVPGGVVGAPDYGRNALTGALTFVAALHGDALLPFAFRGTWP